MLSVKIDDRRRENEVFRAWCGVARHGAAWHIESKNVTLGTSQQNTPSCRSCNAFVAQLSIPCSYSFSFSLELCFLAPELGAINTFIHAIGMNFHATNCIENKGDGRGGG